MEGGQFCFAKKIKADINAAHVGGGEADNDCFQIWDVSCRDASSLLAREVSSPTSHRLPGSADLAENLFNILAINNLKTMRDSLDELYAEYSETAISGLLKSRRINQ